MIYFCCQISDSRERHQCRVIYLRRGQAKLDWFRSCSSCYRFINQVEYRLLNTFQKDGGKTDIRRVGMQLGHGRGRSR
jgi:hypothetical protein